MAELRLTLETVTPLFLAGADPRGKPELRPPAFRGAMRYWLRAVLGGAVGDGDLGRLRALESRVFGSTGGGSPVRVRLHGDPVSACYPILPHKGGASREAFRPGQRFDLTMWQPEELEDESAWKAACAALDLMLTFGGVGLRSRRGYGTLRVMSSSDTGLLPASPRTGKEWVKQVARALGAADAAARSLVGESQDGAVRAADSPPSFPALSTGSTVLIGRYRTRGADEQVKRFMELATGETAFGGIKPRQASPLWVRPVRIEHGYVSLFCLLASRFPGHDETRVAGFLEEGAHYQAQALWPRRQRP